jgi:hypothetical protein
MKILQIFMPFSIHYLANFRLTGVLAVLDSLPVRAANKNSKPIARKSFLW